MIASDKLDRGKCMLKLAVLVAKAKTWKSNYEFDAKSYQSKQNTGIPIFRTLLKPQLSRNRTEAQLTVTSKL